MIFKKYLSPVNKSTPDIMLSKVAKIGLPVTIQSALVAILSLADVLMVSDLGREATASVGIASKWLFVSTMIIAGMASANGILVAQYWGRNDRRTAKTITLLAMRKGVKILLPVTFFITFFSSYIMMLQTGDTSVIKLGSVYLWYCFPVLILTHFVMLCESAMRSSGDTLTPLYLGSITILFNICLNYWLIKGGLGIPAMGVAGAALATTISRLLQVTLMLSFLYKSKHWLITTIVLTSSDYLWSSYKKVAIPTTISALLWAAGVLAYQMIFGHMGTTELAVFSMLGPFESLCYSLFFGLSVACSVLLGQSLGKDEFSHAYTTSKFFIKTVLTLGLSLGLMLLFAKETILSWLNLSSDAFYPFASPVFTVLCCVLWLRMLNSIVINGILRAGGDNQFCLRMDFFSTWMVGVPLTTFAAFVLKWDFQHVYLLILAEDSVKFILCFRRYLKRYWMKNLTIAPA